MIKCLVCGTENLDGSQFCDECGASLTAARRANGEAADSFAPAAYAPPAFQSANVTSVGIPAFVEEHPKAAADGNVPETDSDGVSGGAGDESAAAAAKGFHAMLVIERGAAVGAEFGLTTDESNIGRWDADNGIFPDVDLDAHDPEAKVSRRHARIIRENGRYIIEDLGSTNGTFINRGRRLIPGNRQPLNDGDEVIVGKTFLRFHVNR